MVSSSPNTSSHCFSKNESHMLLCGTFIVMQRNYGHIKSSISVITTKTNFI